MNEQEYNEFVSLIDRSNGPESCHLWQGKFYESQGGYGWFKKETAHRVAWSLRNGEIPPGKVIRHTCDNPPCCNPAHLEIGDHSDNRTDCVSKGRNAKGQNHGHAKLTARQVRFIRTHHKGWTHKAIAEKYGVARSTITRLKNGQGWDGVGSRN
ncbi:MAG: HNH endonuclease [Sulfitobacter sp.]|uniref:HNH endonuclease n=1 Tax=Alphaproteobacteria TaxID=28211 RepID=UPI0029423869|nr:HNH endonuclease [Sulfitobacter sp. LC.270.F.C4]WOI13547.1 HNH endonuclease [Sulfitobacter sp. LC.270.F.C4]